MTDFRLVTAADIPLMQGLAQRVTAIRPDLISADASFGELAWVWGQGRAAYGATWPRELWFSGTELVAWAWAFLPRQVRRSDGSVSDVTGASLSYQVHPDCTELADDVIDWYDSVAAGLERTALPTNAEEFALTRWAAHGYEPDAEALGVDGDWTQLNERALADVEQPALPAGFRFRTPMRPGRKPRSGLMWMPGLRRPTRPRAMRTSSRPRLTVATCTCWWRHRTGQWPPRPSCGSMRRTRPSSSSRSEHIRAIVGVAWPRR